MQQKYKVILFNFDKSIGFALYDWLNTIQDIEAKNYAPSDGELNSFIENWAPNLGLFFQNDGEKSFEDFEIPKSLPIILIGNRARPINGNEVETINLPLRFVGLEAKLREVLRLEAERQMSALRIDDHIFSIAKKAIIAPNGKELKLTDKEISILTYLNLAGGNSIGREELLREVWRYNQGVTTHTLETHIYRLRQKLSELFGKREVLITTDGGYRLQT